MSRIKKLIPSKSAGTLEDHKIFVLFPPFVLSAVICYGTAIIATDALHEKGRYIHSKEEISLSDKQALF